MQLRAAYEQSITSAPAVVAPTAGLVSAMRSAASLPTYQGTWQEVTNKPFVNDPVDRGLDYGEGYGDVTGRLTALTHSGSTVYAASASGGVWRSVDEGSHLDIGECGAAAARGRSNRDKPVRRIGVGRHGRGQQLRREPVRGRGVPAGGGRQPMAARRRLGALRSRLLPHRMDPRVHLHRHQPRPVPSRGRRHRLRPRGRSCCSPPAARSSRRVRR